MQPSTTRVIWSAAPIAFLLVGVIVAGLFVPTPAISGIQDAVANAGSWAALVFVAGYALITLTAAPKLALSVAAGLIWGLPLGFALAYSGGLIGAALAFMVSRIVGRRAVERLTGARVSRVDALLRERGLLTVIGARLIPVIPFTAVNYAAGLTSVSIRSYALGTAIGVIPGTLAYVTVGAYGVTLGWPFFVAMAVLGVLAIGGTVVVARRQRSGGRGDGGEGESARGPDAGGPDASGAP